MSSGGGLAEKFQITVPYSEKGHALEDKDEGKWVSFESARYVDDNPQPNHGNKFNIIPDADIFRSLQENGKDTRSNNFKQGYGGNTDVSAPPVFKDMEKTAHLGFARLDMKATDDQYSGEHVDLFYGEAVDEFGNVGFAERNNYLDRI